MSHQFDLEQQILDCWGIKEDIDILTEAILERDISRDEISNILIGLSSLYQLKFEKTFNTFEQYIKEVHNGKSSLSVPE